MPPRYSLYWTATDIPPQLIAPPTLAERVLRSISNMTAAAAADLRRRRLAETKRLFETTDIGIPNVLRRDIGLPSLPNDQPAAYQDVCQYR